MRVFVLAYMLRVTNPDLKKKTAEYNTIWYSDHLFVANTDQRNNQAPALGDNERYAKFEIKFVLGKWRNNCCDGYEAPCQ